MQEKQTKVHKIATVCAVIGLALYISYPNKATEAKTQQTTVTKACKSDITCLAKANLTYATMYCEQALNQLPKWQYKWDDKYSIFEMSKWSDQANGIITYVGSGIRVRNGFGVWRQADYSCTYDTVNKQVLNVRMQ